MSSQRGNPTRAVDTVSSARSPRHAAGAGTSPRRPPGDPATRQRILDAALRLITKRGGVDIPLAELARAARVSRQALYLHFANRAELLLAVVQHADDLRGMPEAIRQVESAASGIEALRASVTLLARLNPAIWPLARVVESVRRQDAAAERTWQDRMSRRLDGSRAIVERMAKERTLRPGLSTSVAADLLWSLMSLRTWEDLVLTRGWTAKEYEERMTTLLLTALVRDDANLEGDR